MSGRVEEQERGFGYRVPHAGTRFGQSVSVRVVGCRLANTNTNFRL